MGGICAIEVRQEVYKLDKQELADKYAREEAKLVGVLEPSTNTIAVRSIEALRAEN
jgi:hypothetical protein